MTGFSNEVATREKALQRLDEEYRRYRQALEAAFTLAETMMQKALEPVRTELQTIRERLESMPTMPDIPQIPGQGILTDLSERAPDLAAPGSAENSGGAARRPRSRKKEKSEEKAKTPRIRWGTTDEEIRHTVFAQLRSLEEKGKDITITTIKAEVPSMMRYVYGEKALFKGIGELLEEYRSEGVKQASSPAASQVIELPSRKDGSDFDGPEPDPAPMSAPTVTVESEAALFQPELPVTPVGSLLDLSKV
ncbi:hypothetical protein HM1_0487 [Heliomicrobium modesticaldum Ice1]|uniref:Uncharacterized protein n=1 Tax=Heliobacterium modesticaldum (strain ATCC 51547 / Ice1) TaxID=498761 RepID=B0TFK2_HELMI|nr:hypothetical protein [Heliomicrobium modesticaldum]ABZ83101.1 hypothetical protein HM1_0487 [Heliomicrobium modesticaldum Ice1]